MKKIYYIGLLLLILAGFWAGFYFKDNLLNLYHGASQGIGNIEKTDFGSVAGQVAKQLLTPPPLNIGGQENNAVFTKARIIAETNAQRYDNGTLPPLLENTALDTAAKIKAQDIFKNQYFEHVSLSGVDPGQLVKSAGYDYIVSGENLILGNFKDEKELVQAWMDSPGHRANILNNRFVDIGVAIIKGSFKGRTVWVGVQEFGLPLSSCPAPSENLKQQIGINKIQLDDLSIKIDNKRAEINNEREGSAQYNARVEEYNQLVGQYNNLANATKKIINQYNAEVNAFNQCVAGT
ncbi:hypothetical protein KW786_00785 [Candidatus Parcubacteria bacterium]|nr:hypothetical protein [Candidatus Parcubacteria bacterium]